MGKGERSENENEMGMGEEEMKNRAGLMEGGKIMGRGKEEKQKGKEHVN